MKDDPVSLPFISQAVITHAATLRALRGAVEHAEMLGVPICVAVVDSCGQPSGFLRMPGAFLISTDLAQKKALTAAGLGIVGDQLEEVINQEAQRVREGLLLHPNFTLIRGGLPIRLEGQLIGAIGVSGGSEEQDVQCAKAGLAAVSGC